METETLPDGDEMLTRRERKRLRRAALRSEQVLERGGPTEAGGFWTGAMDALPLRLFEVLFTLTFLVWMGRCLMTWEEWLTEAGFHLTAAELASMGYPEPWPLLQGWQVLVFAGLIALGGGLLLWPLARHGAGSRSALRRRLGLILLCGTAIYAQRVDYMSAFTLNKLYVGVFVVLMLAPGVWWSEKRRIWMVSAAPLRVLQATLVLQYFAAGLAKVDGDWLKGGGILWGQVQGVFRTDLAAWALREMPRWSWDVQQHLSLAFELLAPLLFCVTRLRPVAFVMGIGFHLVIALMMKDLIFFSLQMWTFYVLFVSAAAWRRGLGSEK